jgi:hypothetical protein
VDAEVNNPATVAEVEACFRRYETALMGGDVTVMGELFWSSPLVTRFGVGDYQVGEEELAQFRAQRGAPPSDRVLDDTRIVTFGSDAAVVTTLFRYSGSTKLGRQSQTWMRIDGTWQVVQAHVSQIEEAP